MAIPKKSSDALDMIVNAARLNMLALMEVTDSKTGDTVDALCLAAREEDGGYKFVPVAIIPRDCELTERLVPPDETEKCDGSASSVH